MTIYPDLLLTMQQGLSMDINVAEFVHWTLLSSRYHGSTGGLLNEGQLYCWDDEAHDVIMLEGGYKLIFPTHLL